jgi:hypothetical protein
MMILLPTVLTQTYTIYIPIYVYRLNINGAAEA